MDERISAPMATSQSQQAVRMVAPARKSVAADPTTSGQEVVVTLESLAAEADQRSHAALLSSEPDRDVCAKCGSAVEPDPRDRGGHQDREPNGQLSRARPSTIPFGPARATL